jgi:hypothetical protein
MYAGRRSAGRGRLGEPAEQLLGALAVAAADLGPAGKPFPAVDGDGDQGAVAGRGEADLDLRRRPGGQSACRQV